MPSDAGPRARPTLADVAARAGVSKGLASLAVRDAAGPSAKSRERVLAAARELGWQPDSAARVLARHRSRLIGVTYAIRRPFDSEVVEHIYASAEAARYDVALSAITPGRSADRAVEPLLAGRCEALVLLGVGSLSEEDLRGLSEQVPTVVIGQSSGGAVVDTVRTAGAAGAQLAVEHLRELGHSAIVHVDGGPDASAVEHRRGYEEAMAAQGLRKRIRVVAGGATEDDGVTAASRMLEGDLPTAVVAYNDSCATGIISTFQRFGVHVPGDVSVIGYDDSRVARLPYFELTTVAQDSRQLASLAVQRSVGRLEGDLGAPEEVVLAPKLIRRATTARLIVNAPQVPK
ncbi:LacI family DNA-binding transcriptional regulator [Pseudonocardia tropica]|uniref:LacI family DNA-binding transcriptional regulator n=1 Tax=Pseudonocardia tropica TaxID=681289 RepID=A0ABV1JXR1_9PSEU